MKSQHAGIRGSKASHIYSLVGNLRSFAAITAMAIFASSSAPAQAEVLHHYGNSVAHEIVNVVAVDMAKLRPLVPAAYTIVPASSVHFGRPDQGLVVIENVQAFNAVVDSSALPRSLVHIDVAILIAEPASAASLGLNIPGAFHLYLLRIFTDDPRFSASLHSGGMPVEFDQRIGYERTMDDTTGVGNLVVTVPDRYPFLYSINTSQGYAPHTGANVAAFWHDGERGTTVLSFVDQPFRQGGALSRIYTRPNGSLQLLLNGGGLESCPPDQKTGFICILAPSVNFKFDNGTVGKLQLLKPSRPNYRSFPQWVRM